jgi:hypothetical protein
MDFSGWDIRNLLQGHSLALLLIYIGALIAVGLLSFTFKGSVVV